MANKLAQMLNRENTAGSHQSLPHLTVAVLQDELNNLRKDVCQEMKRLLELHTEHLDDSLDHIVGPKVSAMHRPEHGRLAGDSRATRRPNTHFIRMQTMNFQDHDLAFSDEGEEEDKEPHPFLKRNPRTNGTFVNRVTHEGSTQTTQTQSGRARGSVMDRDRHTECAVEKENSSHSRSGRFQLIPQGDTTDAAAGVHLQERPELAQPLAEPEVIPQRELRLSSAERGGRLTRDREEKTDAADEAQTRRPCAKHIVHSKFFEHLVGVMVLLNAVILGVETESQWKKRRDGDPGSPALAANVAVFEAIFCVVFASELILRIVVDGCEFFVGHEWAWNLYDLIAIGLQILEQASNVCTHFSDVCSSDMHNTHLIRDINILRVIRVTRLIRMVRLLEELRMIVASICSSMLSLGWTFLLLMMLLYSLALFFTEVVLQNIHHSAHKDDMEYWFGGLGRTFLTMFECIFGGVSWDEVLNPLIEEVSGLLSVVFCLYIAFAVLAMMNMATGVFVDNAMRKAQEDKDTNTAKRISDLFFNDPVLGQAESITLEQFCSKIDTPEMQDYFKAINVDPSEAKGLYRLLDADDSGSIDAAEMVAGCLRLRGGAKALELSLLMHEVNRMGNRTTIFQARVEKALAWIVESVESKTHPHDDKARELFPADSTPQSPSNRKAAEIFSAPDAAHSPLHSVGKSW